MRNFGKHIISLLVVLFFTIAVSAQSRTIVDIDGKRYYQHIVESGNTLYAIAKLYQVDEEVLIRYNPGIEDGLKLEQALLIPIDEEEASDKWTNPIRIEGNFMIHRVKRKETLYGISKEYLVTVNDIIEHNPEAEKNLSKGMELKIPINDINEITLQEELSSIALIDSTDYITHKVQTGQTLYFLSKKYHVSVEDIKAINNGLPEGLKKNSTILIALIEEEEIEKVDHELNEGELLITRTDSDRNTLSEEFVLPMDDEIFKDNYGVAVMLPFYFNKSEGSLSRKESKLQEISIHFYQGLLVSLDSLKDYGLNLNLFVYDVNDKESQLDSIFDLPEMENVQVVIGPLQKSQFEKASDYCRTRGIHIVCPVKQNNKILVDHPNVSKAAPSYYTQMEQLGKEVANVHRNDNVILVNSIDIQDTRMVKAFKESYLKEMELSKELKTREMKEVKATVKHVENISSKLDPNQRNIIVVPSKDKVAIQDIFTQLARTSSSIFDITVYGIEEWWDYKFIDFDYKIRFNLSIATSQYVDYTSKEVKTFINDFKDEVSFQPNQYAFLGYDLMTFYGRGLLQFGTRLSLHMNEINQDALLITGFNYHQHENKHGYENQYTVILETKVDRIEKRDIKPILKKNFMD